MKIEKDNASNDIDSFFYREALKRKGISPTVNKNTYTPSYFCWKRLYECPSLEGSRVTSRQWALLLCICQGLLGVTDLGLLTSNERYIKPHKSVLVISIWSFSLMTYSLYYIKELYQVLNSDFTENIQKH